MSYLAPESRPSAGLDRASAPADEAALGDIGLIVGIGRRRVAALAEAYRRHGGSMYDATVRICGPAPAEEVVRTVLLDLWREPGGYDPERSSLRGFLLQQAHAAAVERVRRGTRSAGVDVGGGAGGWELDRRALASRAGDHAWSLLSTLDGDERDTIALAYFCGYSSGRLGELLDEADATVRTRIRTGITAIGARAGRIPYSR